MNRRRFICAGLALTPLAAALSACGQKGVWPEGMVEIKWDRDTCTRCSMVISDRRFAAQLRGGAKNIAFKFDDIGCAVVWIRDKAKDYTWLNNDETKFWVADIASTGDKWLDARKALFVGGKTSPMAYNFGASTYPQAGAQDFQEM
ncbi:MAG: nitrous oxide reductase accessory protein NosL, partial [Sulfuritalea sp.]|nr:nitrous oxide reductase accessory protein NosL [Sulfuritalea sp.]